MSHQQPVSAVTFFYFDFSDNEKQHHDNLLRSMIFQLSTQSTGMPKALKELYTGHRDGRRKPSTERLLVTLKELIGGFQHTFIILDALDECTSGEELLDLINEITQWKMGKLHILATSRKEKYIEEVLEPLVTSQVCIHGKLIHADIRSHIQERLLNDRKLRKLPAKLKEEIEVTLMGGAHGMYGNPASTLVSMFTFAALTTS